MTDPICPYCGNLAILTTGKETHPTSPYLHPIRFWSCLPCDAHVGCLIGTTHPLGRLANAELRNAKILAHMAFNRIWHSGEMSKTEAWAWLAKAMGITLEECDMHLFDLVRCQRVVTACENRHLEKDPIPKGAPDAADWAKLVQVCQERLAEYQTGNTDDSDLPHYIYERAMEAVYGPKIFEWLRAKGL